MPIRQKKSLLDKIEPHVKDLAAQADGIRHQVVDKAPDLRDQIVAALPDRDQLVDLRDDLFERLPDQVQEKLPERAKPKRKRLRKVAAIGVLTGAGAAAFAILKRRGEKPASYTPPAPAAAAPTTKAPSTVNPTTVNPSTANDFVGGDPLADEPKTS